MGYTRPGTLQLVLKLLGSPDAVWGCGPDAREFDLIELDDGGNEPDREPTPFRAISASETRTIDEPDILRGHRAGGPRWYWISENPAQYPETPFLLTDNAAHHLVYHGEAILLPSKAAVQLAEREFREKGRSDIPIFGEGWFGLVRLLPPHTDRGVCWIYADRDIVASGRHDGVHWGDYPIGTLIFPPH